MFKSAEGKILIWFAAILLVMLASVFIAYRATQTLIENERRVSHTQDVLFQINETFTILQSAETGQRGFLLTGAEKYLEPYNQAVADISQNLNKLNELILDNPNQVKSLGLLRQRIDEKFSEMDETIRLRQQSGISLIQKVRKLAVEDGGKTPAVALTAYARVEDRLKTLSAGFQMHVPKPVEPAELVAIVASLTGRTK